MWNPRSIPRAFSLLLLLLHSVLALVYAQGSNATTWNTLTGSPPLVIARGGFSGIFPDSSYVAYDFAVQTGLKNLILWCDVQLTKDSQGICVSNIKLENATDIKSVFPNRSSTYTVNGLPTTAYFSVDFTFKELHSNVALVQGDYTRTSKFDYSFAILTVNDIRKAGGSKGLWLNIQHDAFYQQHNLSMRNFIRSVSKTNISYISSPEAGFLRSIRADIDPKKTKLIFRFLEKDDVDPSANQSYGSLLKNLTYIKTFASGILVLKEYIWPIDPSSLYLQPHTSLVFDAHNVGLEIFASNFQNDIPISFNYSYDSVNEHLNFIDYGNLSVDGVLSDFPLTSSAAIDCFANAGLDASKKVNISVISKYGASGDYPPCTGLAYINAISDGADVLDCPVQMSNDGIPFCSSSIDLTENTDVAQSHFSKRGKTVPEIKPGNGIFTFDLSWDEIRSLSPSMLNPYFKFSLLRNPRNDKKGKFLTLSDFLNLINGSTSLSGAVIIIENAAFLASNRNLSVTDAVIDTLSKAGYDQPGRQKVMIQSKDSSVLKKFKEKKTQYELVYKIDEIVGDVVDAAISDIKRFAHSVVVEKDSVYPQNDFFLTGSTKIVQKFKSSNLSVYVETFSNEFVSQAWDFLADATVEINTFVQKAKIDGVITDYPKTADRYRKNKCLNLGKNTPYMEPAEIGGLLQIMDKYVIPPAKAPAPSLTEDDVTESPLPPVSRIAPSVSPNARDGTTPLPSPNAQVKVSFSFYISTLALLLPSLLL